MRGKPPTRYASPDGGSDPIALEPTDEPIQKRCIRNPVCNAKAHTQGACVFWAVTCHLHFWQNDRDFLRATAGTRGWNGYLNKSQHRKFTLEKKILPPLQQGFEPATFLTLRSLHSTETGSRFMCLYYLRSLHGTETGSRSMCLYYLRSLHGTETGSRSMCLY